MRILFVFVLLLGLFSCGEDNSSSSDTISLNSNDSPLKKDDVKVNSNKRNDTLVAKNKNVKDFISDLDLATVLNSEVSMDFACLGIFGNELGEHHDLCIKKKYSLYTYDTLWNGAHWNQKITYKPRPVFLTESNFKKYSFTDEFVMEENYLDYFNDRFHYHIGNGFAFNNLNDLQDFNNDGFLDLKIGYTEITSYSGTQYANSVDNETHNAVKEEYDKKIKEKTINDSVTFDEYKSEYYSEHFGWFGIGYLTKKSKDGLLLFYKK